MEQTNEIRQYRFLKANPAGNTTIFVLDKTNPKDRSAIANELMEDQCGLCAEQVAFLDCEPPRPADFSIAMMGGEFCGNATRSAAAWLVFDRERYQPSGRFGDKGNFEISCSGVDHNIRCHVVMESRTRFNVTADMPLPLSIEPVDVKEQSFWKVDCDGIVHFVRFFTPKEDPCRQKEHWVHDVLDEFPTPAGKATGVIFLNNSDLNPLDIESIDPYVYVKDTDTLVHESSCGSGTASAVAAVAASLGQSVRAHVGQRRGIIDSEAVWKEGRLLSLSIGGPVDIIAEGIAYVELNPQRYGK